MNPASAKAKLSILRLAISIACLTLFGIVPVAAAEARSCQSVFAGEEQILRTKQGEIILTSEEAIQLRRDQIQIASALKLSGSAKLEALKKYFAPVKKSRAQVMVTLANFGMAITVGAHIATKLAHDPGLIVPTVALLPATLFATDLVSGFFHKFLDSYASEKNKAWGSAARAFRIHHEFPANHNEVSYLQNVSAMGPMIAPLIAATAIASPHLPTEIQTQAVVMLMLFANGHEIHRQAHLKQSGPIIRKLQAAKIFLSKDDHNLHNAKPTDSDYGIINGWSNRATAKLWPVLDKIMWKATKKLPHNWVQTPNSIPDSVMQELLTDLSRVPESLIVSAVNSKHSDSRVDELVQLWLKAYHPQAND